jgi:V-type H+-transporting ATPase proteolipid subunit
MYFYYYYYYIIQIGTWKSGISIVHTGIRHPRSVMKNVIPIVMAGVIGIYGLIVGVIIAQSIVKPTNARNNSYSTYSGLAHLCAGLCTGMSGLAAGMCIGIVGDYGIRAVGYRASQITLFPSDKEAAGYSNIPDQDGGDHNGNAGGGGGEGSGDISGSEDQNKLFVGMLIMLIFSEALALYGMIVALIVSQHSYSCQ